MKILKNIIIASAFVLGTGLVSCIEDGMVSAPAPEVKVPQLNPDAINGELFVKFTPAVASVLEKAGVTKSGEKMPLTRSGVLSVDEILDMVKGYQIERIFPADPRTEADARKAGMDLWYIVRFGEEFPVQEVAAKLALLGEVTSVQYNCQLHRADYGKAVPLTSEMVSRMTAPSSAWFNDPFYMKQWNMVNYGPESDLALKSQIFPGFEDRAEEAASKFQLGADVGIYNHDTDEYAWNLTTGHPSVIVAIVDEGVDVTHPDLKSSMWVNEGEIYGDNKDNDGNGYRGDLHGYNFAYDTGVISTDNVMDSGHGTHVAGVIAARNNNGIGVSSIAGGNSDDNGVRIMSCQIFGGTKLATVLEEVRAIKYAADNGAVILQCSWGYVSGSANGFEWQPQFRNDDEWKKYSPLEYLALDYFIHTAGTPDGVIDGGIAVFAGGNESAPAAGYPGAYPKFVSVASTAADFTPSVFTNYGPGTSISAPGGDFDYYYEYGDGINTLNTGAVGAILSTLPAIVTGDNGEMTGYGYMEGTSMACPHVSGVLALGLSYAARLHKHFKAEDVKNLLYDSAKPLDDFMKGTKSTFKFVADLGHLHEKQLPLKNFKGQMGAGQVNAFKFLQAIAGENAGTPMVFPNVVVEIGASVSYDPSVYEDFGDYSIEIEDKNIADLAEGMPQSFHAGDSFTLVGKNDGQTRAKVAGKNGERKFVITVRKKVSDNSWM